MYLALAASRGRHFLASRLPAQGKFMGGRAEAQAAQALGLPINAHLHQRAEHLRGSRRGRGLGGLASEAATGNAPDDVPYQFIPWWKWGNLARPGKFRWVTAAFYASLFIVTLMGIVAMTWRLLKGGF